MILKLEENTDRIINNINNQEVLNLIAEENNKLISKILGLTDEELTYIKKYIY